MTIGVQSQSRKTLLGIQDACAAITNLILKIKLPSMI